MTAGVFVGVDSGGTRTNVKIRFRSADGAERPSSYESDVNLSGALQPSRIPEFMRRVLAPLPAKIDELSCGGIPTYIWIGAAGFTPWTRDGFMSAVTNAGENFGVAISSIGIANDAVSILLGSGADGVIVAGTGSSVIVRATDGRMHQAGGHEWVACDDGSGFWIGLHGIRIAFRNHEDGKNSALLQRMRETYGIRPGDDRGMIKKVRELAIADPDMKREIARFAQNVCPAAEQGDVAAQNLVKTAAEDLADVAASAVRRNIKDKLTSGLKLAQCGSLLSNAFYQSAFETQIAMRLGSGTEQHTPIDWRRAVTGAEECVTVAQQLAIPDHKIHSLPQDDFQPTITSFAD